MQLGWWMALWLAVSGCSLLVDSGADTDAAVDLDAAPDARDGCVFVPKYGDGDECLAAQTPLTFEEGALYVLDTDLLTVTRVSDGSEVFAGEHYALPGIEVALVAVPSLDVPETTTLRAIGSRPLYIYSHGAVSVGGTIDLNSARGAPGAGSGAGCEPFADPHSHGTDGPDGDSSTVKTMFAGNGGGGGGGLGPGGDGGQGGSDLIGQGGNGFNGSPLHIVGGCNGGTGGGSSEDTDADAGAGPGGGGIYIVSVVSIELTDGLISAGGGGGAGGAGVQIGGAEFGGGGGGGGAGGFVALQAPTVTIGSGAALAANGGGGGGGGDAEGAGFGDPGNDATDDRIAQSGPSAAGMGDGGNGAGGASLAGENGRGQLQRGGGGGGGGGGLVDLVGDTIVINGNISPAP